MRTKEEIEDQILMFLGFIQDEKRAISERIASVGHLYINAPTTDPLIEISNKNIVMYYQEINKLQNELKTTR